MCFFCFRITTTTPLYKNVERNNEFDERERESFICLLHTTTRSENINTHTHRKKERKKGIVYYDIKPTTALKLFPLVLFKVYPIKKSF